MLDQDRFVVNLNSQILDKKNRDEPFLWFPWVLCAFLSPHTDFTDLTDFISLDVNVFRALRGFCVPLSDPLNIRVHLCPLCAIFYPTQNSQNSRILSLMLLLLCVPWFPCALIRDPPVLPLSRYSAP